MSSTTLQTPPLLNTSNSALHQYPSSHSSPSREAYHANQINAAASASAHSSRRPSRSRSGNGASVSSPSPKSSQPGLDAPAMTSRAAAAHVVTLAAQTHEYHQSPASDRRKNAMPPVAPPRTSSTNHNGPPSSGGTSRRAASSNERMAATPRQNPSGENSRAPANGVQDSFPRTEDPRTTTSSRSRRAYHQQMAQEPSDRSSSNGRDGRHGAPAVAARSVPAQQQPSASKYQPLDESDAINRIAQPAPTDSHDKIPGETPFQEPLLLDPDDAAPPPVIGLGDHAEPAARSGGRSRHDRSAKRDKNTTKFGEYILGNIIGEGEFGKVRLGWKQADTVQVAIKIIKRESLGNNPARLGKIHREVNILRDLSHPNIVHLYDMINDDTRIGIVLEYASGGELFDYILNHRYLKDNAARRLFAQLISGVGYLHKKGIVHRDLKLENLLLDRNRNIIITDFGFANIFDPKDELTEEEEQNLSDRDFAKRFGLDKVKANGTRRGDLMQTSCGSPCYAAPELVVSDSLYTGRKVDVWSCGVILYAMLAGYLPFDDDPANPEGDNINLLYKYIVNTPLTFPEYVSPHARDLLRRILVPNPRRRADLFEVARHSWLIEYASVVRIITSSTTTSTDIQNTTVTSDGDSAEGPGIGRSASVREAAKSKAAANPTVGGLASKHGHIDQEAEAAALAKQQKDAKRRTVQVEYVPPTTQTQRGEYTLAYAANGSKSKTRPGSQGRVDAAAESAASPPIRNKPLPKDPPVSRDAYAKSNRLPPNSHRDSTQSVQGRRPSYEANSHAYMTTAAGAVSATAVSRPQTGGSLQTSMGVPPGGRGGYGQPVPPTVAGTNAHGRIQQPLADIQDPQAIANVPSKFANVSGFASQTPTNPGAPGGGEFKGHKRSSTIGDISSKLLGRSGSLFGNKNRKRADQQGEKSRKYPPISMSNAMPTADDPRQSIDSRASRRSISLGFGKKRSGSIASASQNSDEKQRRRFSLLPQSLSRAIGLDRETPPDRQSQQDLPMREASRGYGEPQSRPDTTPIYDSMRAQQPTDAARDVGRGDAAVSQATRQQHQRFDGTQYDRRASAIPQYVQQNSVLHTGSDSSVDRTHKRQASGAAPYPLALSSEPDMLDGGRRSRNGRGVLQKNKRFTDAYDQEGYYRGHEGSSGAAKRVMDFFRRRSKAPGQR